MSAPQRIEIHFEQSIEAKDPPGFEIDPEGELTPFEHGIHQFAHDEDCLIRVQVGGESTSFQAYRDLVPVLFDLPDGVADLSAGRPFSFQLAELKQSLRFSPMKDVVRCELRGFGGVKLKEVVLSKIQVVETFVAFLEELLRRAVSAGYVTRLDVAAFLSPLGPQAKRA